MIRIDMSLKKTFLCLLIISLDHMLLGSTTEQCRCQQSDDRSCTPCSTSAPTCIDVDTLPLRLGELVPMSPFFQPTMLRNNLTEQFNSVCITFIPLTLSRFLEFRTKLLYNGTVIIEKFLEADLEKLLTVRYVGFSNEYGNSTFVANEYGYFMTPPICPPILSVYRCILVQDCAGYDGNDYRFGLTSVRDPPDFCISLCEDSLNDPKYNFTGNEFVRPQYSDFKCVVRVGNVSVINDFTVPEANRIYL